MCKVAFPNPTQEEDRTQKKMCMWPKAQELLGRSSKNGAAVRACGPCTQEEDVHVAQGTRIALPQLEEWGCHVCMRPIIIGRVGGRFRLGEVREGGLRLGFGWALGSGG